MYFIFLYIFFSAYFTTVPKNSTEKIEKKLIGIMIYGIISNKFLVHFDTELHTVYQLTHALY